MMNFYAKDGADKWMWDNLIMPMQGCYVDLGAAKPFEESNTAFLRELGWHGLAVDGNPEYAPMWRTDWDGQGDTRAREWTRGQRNAFLKSTMFECAILSSEPDVNFVINRRNCWMSRLEEGVRDPAAPRAVTLETVLAKYVIGKIGLLNVDLEGAEYSVCMTMNWTLHRPQIVVAEYDTGGIGQDFRLFEWLVKSGFYTVVHMTDSNIIYMRK